MLGVTGLAALVTCVACAHDDREPFPDPLSPPASGETPSILVPGTATPRLLRIEVSAISRRGTPPKINANVVVGATIPPLAGVSSCIESARDDVCTSYACEGFPNDVDNPSRFTAGPIHIDVGETNLVLEPAITGTYIGQSSNLPEGPITSIPIVVAADGRQIPAFRLETTFPPHALLIVPGRDIVPDDFAKPLFVGAALQNEDLTLTIDPPDAPIDAIITGVAPSSPSDGCTIGSRCTVTTHCLFPSGRPRIPAAIFQRYKTDSSMDVTVVSTRHLRERRAGFDIDLVTQTSAYRVRYLLH